VSSDRGFVLFYRSFWDNNELKEPGRPFSKREAWLYLFSNLANGIDRNGVPRGEFKASIRFLCQAWNWDRDKVHRFLIFLRKSNMINALDGNRNVIAIGQNIGQNIGHFTICNYSSYQDISDTKSDTKSDKSKQCIKQSIKEIKNTSESVITLILKSGEEFPITKDHLAKFSEAYPKTDIMEKLRQMKVWCISNPDKRKTASGILRFVNSWISREYATDKNMNKISGLNFGEKI
jgi:hypothetical protein